MDLIATVAPVEPERFRRSESTVCRSPNSHQKPTENAVFLSYQYEIPCFVAIINQDRDGQTREHAEREGEPPPPPCPLPGSCCCVSLANRHVWPRTAPSRRLRRGGGRVGRVGVLHDRARRRGPGGRRGDRVPGEHHRRRRRRGLRGRRVAPRVRQVGRRGRAVPGVHFLRRRRGRGARRGGGRGGAGRRGGPRGGREAGAGDRRGHAQAASPCGLRRPAAAVRVRRRGRVRPRLGTPHLPRSPRRARRVLVRRRRGIRRGRQRVRDRHQGQQDLEGEPGRRAAPRHHERHLHPASRDGEQPHRRQRHRLPPQRLPPRHPHLRGRPLQGGPQDGGRERRQGAGLPEEGRRAGAALRDEAGRRRHADPARRELRRLGDRECHGPVRRAGAPGRVVGHGEGRGCVRQPHLRIRIRHEEDARHCQSGVRAFVARPPGGASGHSSAVIALTMPFRL